MDNFESDLDALLNLKARAIAREIDAGACGTNSDYKRARAAEVAFLDARDNFLTKWSK